MCEDALSNIPFNAKGNPPIWKPILRARPPEKRFSFFELESRHKQGALAMFFLAMIANAKVVVPGRETDLFVVEQEEPAAHQNASNFLEEGGWNVP